MTAPNLELKHLAPYLPYGLKVKFKNVGLGEMAIAPIHALYPVEVIVKNDAGHLLGRGYDQIKPILRPLSDLTKIIGYGKSKYCVLDIWLSIEQSEENDFKVLGKVPEYYKQTAEFIKKWTQKTDYGLMEVLFEHHFDVFGLIEKGLAIDINTLGQ